MEVLPYLEIACGTDTTSNEPPSPFKEEGDDSLEKQGSLIALAWSRPTGPETDETSGEAAVQPEVQDASGLCGAVSLSAEFTRLFRLHV